MLTFITSIRHPQNSNSYPEVLKLLEATLKSICNQSDPDFHVIVVCNQKPEIEFNDPRIEYVSVDFPPPSPHRGSITSHETIQKDKGCKYAIGLVAAQRLTPEYIMFFDADDFVHKDIAKHCKRYSGRNGWYVSEGFIHRGGSMLYSRVRDFYKWCGTCNIIRLSLLSIPGHLTTGSSTDEIEASINKEFLYKVLGNHPFTVGFFSCQEAPLSPLPYPGAIYVKETGENHSGEIFYGRYATGLPRIVNLRMSKTFGMDIKVTPWRKFKALFFEYPIELFRLIRYKKPLRPPV